MRVRAPNPGVYTLDGTNTWIVGDGPAAVIDPGPDDPEHLYRVQHEAGEIGAVLLTHDHEDHAPGAALLSETTGAPIMAFRPPRGERKLHDGDEVQVGGATLVAIHVPGHSPDSVAFLARQVSALFTGDTVLGTGTSVIDPPEGDLVLYLRSLRRMQDLRARIIYPGHGPVVFGAQAKLEEYIAHRIEREQQVLTSLEDGMSTVEDMVFDIYEEYPSELYPLAARSVLAHLLKLENEGRVESFQDEDLEHWAIAGERRCERCGGPVSGRGKFCDRCSIELLQERPEPAMLADWPVRGRAKVEESPAEHKESPTEHEESPTEHEESPAEHEESPAEHEESPADPDPDPTNLDSQFSWLWEDDAPAEDS